MEHSNFCTIFFSFFLVTFLAHSLIATPANAPSLSRPLSSSSSSLRSSNKTNITAVFAIGDSTLDSGNNNYIGTSLRSDHPPYGRDFPSHVATGRFCNGKLTLDFLVSTHGIKENLPPYLDPKLRDGDLVTGVSFASAGAGLDNRTGALFGALTIENQLDYFDKAVERMRNEVGDKQSQAIVKDALFVVSAGTNDVVFNLNQMPVSRYHDELLRKLQSVVQRLYKAGARKVAVAGLPPVGCLPIKITMESKQLLPYMLQRACIDQPNKDSQAYNTKLKSLLSKLQSTTRDLRIVYLDIYSPLMDMTQKPSKYGFEETLRGCCGTGLLEMGELCIEISPTCPDASSFMFWDSVHPTQAAYSYLFKSLDKTAFSKFTHS